MTNILLFLGSLMSLMVRVYGDATEDFDPKLEVEFADMAGQSQQYFWLDATAYESPEKKQELSFERGDNWHKYNTLTFERKTDGDPRTIYYDRNPLQPNNMAYECEVSVTEKPPAGVGKISFDLVAGQEGSSTHVVKFDCGKDKVELDRKLIDAFNTAHKSATQAAESATTTPSSNEVSTSAANSPAVSSTSTDGVISSAVDSSAGLTPTPVPRLMVTFLAPKDDDYSPSWIDTTIYDYDAGKTDRLLGNKTLDSDKPNAVGEMLFTKQADRKYSWQENYGNQSYATTVYDCTFNITAVWDISELFVQLTRKGQGEIVTEKGIPWGTPESLKHGCVAVADTESGGADAAYNEATAEGK